MITYTPSNWYWVVGGSPSQVYSSAADDYVPVSDAAYVAWLWAGNLPTKIDTEQNLADVLVQAGEPPPPGASPSDTLRDAAYGQIPLIIRNWMFAVDNRVRTLEGQPPRDKTTFRQYVKGLPNP